MTKMLEVYKCGVCGNITMVVSPSTAPLPAASSPWSSRLRRRTMPGMRSSSGH